MKYSRPQLLALLLVLATPVLLPAATIINFDEFTSPPVDCCFGNPVVGPLVYPDVTIQDGAGGGTVMNFNGWSNMQTSGENLFGTLSGSMILTFNSAVSGLSLDLINGTGAAAFTFTLYDQADGQIDQSITNLNDFSTPGSVATLNPATAGIWKAVITGSSDFAIDTISFNAGPVGIVPEPSTFGLAGLSLAALVVLRRRIRR